MPAMAEFFPGFFAASWFGIVAPPEDTAGHRLEAVAKPWLRPCGCPTRPSACTGSAPPPVGSTPDETRVFLRQETERWRKVILNAGIKLQ